MITYLDISIFESPAQALVNTVNTVGVMGKGIAKTFKHLYPDMFQRYVHFCATKQLEVGKLFVHRTANKTIVNFPTKKHWRNPARISYIEAGLQKFVKVYHLYGISSVSFPQLGCGNGGLDWESQVRPLMEKYLKCLPIPVYIHVFSHSQGFVPEHIDAAFVEEIRLQRKTVSFERVWQDLSVNIKRCDFAEKISGLSVSIDLERVCIHYYNQNIPIERMDLEELWDILQKKGSLHQSDLPYTIISQKIGETLLSDMVFDMLSSLKYVRLISLGVRSAGDIVHKKGLIYFPYSIKNLFEEQ